MLDAMKSSPVSDQRDRIPLAGGTIIFTVVALSLGEALIKE